MMHIHRSCRNVTPNLKLLSKHNKYRQNCVGNLSYSDRSDVKNSPVEQKSNKRGSKNNSDNEKNSLPEEPTTTCCMSGCANCVWLEYAEKLSEYYKDGGEQAVKEIKEKVQDENIKAFLLFELRMRNMKE